MDEYHVRHERYIDVHPSVLAHNVVCSLIMAKGVINKWDAMLERLLQEMHGEIRGIEAERDRLKAALEKGAKGFGLSSLDCAGILSPATPTDTKGE